MDIDVKNAYTKVIKACGSNDFEGFLAQIHRFINYISLSGAEDRFDEFCDIYVQYEIDKERLADYSGEVPNDPEITAFFTVLGKYYLFSSAAA